ncbi:hypothetical protein BV898_19592 [Hypsibius exemplaris]|uniref:Uncharacterized protein n=1 Tax=Hypsibius exemplaris TaxID=2072580 RepID=A0A9X6RP33_HYPEX|nr:hypothetical protein BV898_19592 [Hypsibius exemplaris]
MRLATSEHSYADNEVSISARAAQLGLLTPVTVLLSEKEPIVLAKREKHSLPPGWATIHGPSIHGPFRKGSLPSGAPTVQLLLRQPGLKTISPNVTSKISPLDKGL